MNKSGFKTRLGSMLCRLGSPKAVQEKAFGSLSWGRGGEEEAKTRRRQGEGEAKAKARRRQGEGEAKARPREGVGHFCDWVTLARG